MIDLTAAWNEHKARVLEPRDDGTILHASDLHACSFALHQRLSGVAQLPFDDDTFANFERGHAYEGRVAEAIRAYAIPRGYSVTHGEEVLHEGIVGNLDWVLYEAGHYDAFAGVNAPEKAVAVIDLSTTAKKTPDWSYGHALKSAFYAVAKGCDRFCEMVLCIGFGGKVTAVGEHWFNLSDLVPNTTRTWHEAVLTAICNLDELQEQVQVPTTPPLDPISGEVEAWRCGKKAGVSYCQARCPMNRAYDADLDVMEVPA